jgi:hypothetical protein
MEVAEDLDLGETPRSFSFEDDVDQAFALVLDVIRLSPVEEALVRNSRYQHKLLAQEAELLALQRRAGSTDRQNEQLLGRGHKTTSADAKKRVKRANAVNENPDLADDLANEELGPEQLDAIATGSAKSNGDAARDPKLIERVKNSNPDDATTIVNEWVDGHTSPDQHETRRNRQRRTRKISRFMNKRGNDVLHIEGDTESIDEIHENLRALSKKLYDRDGGRNVPGNKHVRTRDQRMFDAAHQLLTTPEGGASGASKGGGSRGRVKLHVWMTLDQMIDGGLRATLANGGTLPPNVLSRYMCNGSIAGTAFDQKGEVVWHGRELRAATPAQISSLIARDKGCVLCRADAAHCEAHHLIPFNSPDRGETNTSDMALVCTDCHHHIHENNQTLYRNGKAIWKLRAATPGETPPKRPAGKRRQDE